ncbi:hypothetical protein D3C81_1501840 [compost metagenome]
MSTICIVGRFEHQKALACSLEWGRAPTVSWPSIRLAIRLRHPLLVARSRTPIKFYGHAPPWPLRSPRHIRCWTHSLSAFGNSRDPLSASLIPLTGIPGIGLLPCKRQQPVVSRPLISMTVSSWSANRPRCLPARDSTCPVARSSGERLVPACLICWWQTQSLSPRSLVALSTATGLRTDSPRPTPRTASPAFISPIARRRPC